MIRKCLWDESYIYEANENDNYKLLCKDCYFNIYKELYSDKYQWHDFLKNIETIKAKHRINELEKELAFYKQKLVSLDGNSETLEVECLFCGERFQVDPKEAWKYACTDCFKKFVVPLRRLYDQRTIKTLIVAFKEAHGNDNFELEDIMKFAK